ncbi:hypothetical protein BH18ACT2_BH18ACT2_24030 [soil metagenome]
MLAITTTTAARPPIQIAAAAWWIAPTATDAQLGSTVHACPDSELTTIAPVVAINAPITPAVARHHSAATTATDATARRMASS